MPALHQFRELWKELPFVRLRPWRELALLALVVMETSWVALCYHSLPLAGIDASYSRAFWSLGTIYTLAVVLPSAFSALQLLPGTQRRILLVFILASLLVGFVVFPLEHDRLSLGEFLSRPIKTMNDFLALIPAEFAVLLAILLVWWRGVEIAQKFMEPALVMGSFRTGLVFFGVYGLLVRQVENSAGLALYIFLAAGLLAMSTARISALVFLRGGRQARFNRSWITGLVLAAFSVAGLAALSVTIIREYAAGGLASLFRLAGAVLGVLFFTLILPPLTLILKALFALFKWAHVSDVLEQLSALANRIILFFQNLFGGEGGSSGIDIPFFRPLFFLSVLVFIVLMILAALSVRFLNRSTDEEETEPLGGQEDVLALLRAELRRRLQRLREQLARRGRWRSARRLLAAARVRRIYTQLLQINTRLGNPRQPAQTPLEYLPLMEQMFPSFSSELEMITSAYQRVRYGLLAENLNDLEAIEHAWQRVADEGRARLAVQKRNSKT